MDKRALYLMQDAFDDQESLEHYGVLGMKWRIHKARKADADYKALKKAKKQAKKQYNKDFNKAWNRSQNLGLLGVATKKGRNISRALDQKVLDSAKAYNKASKALKSKKEEINKKAYKEWYAQSKSAQKSNAIQKNQNKLWKDSLALENQKRQARADYKQNKKTDKAKAKSDYKTAVKDYKDKLKTLETDYKERNKKIKQKYK